MIEAWEWYSLLYLAIGVVMLEASDKHLPNSMRNGLSMARFLVIILWLPVVISALFRLGNKD